MQVTKIAGNLAVVLPKTLVNALDLKEGDEVQISIKPSISDRVWEPNTGTAEESFEFFKELSAASTAHREFTREEALDRIGELSKSLPVGYKFDREEANAR
jgi:antitoxin MazE